MGERLDPGLVHHTDTTSRSLGDEVLRTPDMFAPQVRFESGADAPTRMLDFLGRTV